MSVKICEAWLASRVIKATSILNCDMFSLNICAYKHLFMLFPQGLSGGTTVSGTMIAAHKAGIPVFVTGGIGGVHRDGENSKMTSMCYNSFRFY